MRQRRHIFAISPRTRDLNGYWTDICRVAELSEKHGFTGVLLFTGNDTYLEPWVVTQELLKRTRTIAPLVAVNPVYMHPFAVAKTVASLVRLYERKIYLNMVVGTALSQQHALGDLLSHDERYVRLAEYIEIVKSLLNSKRPLNFTGTYYQTDRLQLFPAVASELTPEFLLAGQSEAARRVCAATGSIGVQMLPASLVDVLPKVPGVHFGIIARASEGTAWQVARTLFPENDEYRAMLQYSMSNTDAQWKRRMHAESERTATVETGYWLGPFANFQADCPYLVGSHQAVAKRLQQLAERGVSTFILDIPPTEEEFDNVDHALRQSGILT
jgi:alkanesulfonate monooxygenase